MRTAPRLTWTMSPTSCNRSAGPIPPRQVEFSPSAVGGRSSVSPDPDDTRRSGDEESTKRHSGGSVEGRNVRRTDGRPARRRTISGLVSRRLGFVSRRRTESRCRGRANRRTDMSAARSRPIRPSPAATGLRRKTGAPTAGVRPSERFTTIPGRALQHSPFVPLGRTMTTPTTAVVIGTGGDGRQARRGSRRSSSAGCASSASAPERGRATK